jgi:hypothetical protein
MRLKYVVFPEPFGPMIAFTEPVSISRLISLTATSPPKLLVNPLVFRMKSFVEGKQSSSHVSINRWQFSIRKSVANNISFGISFKWTISCIFRLILKEILCWTREIGFGSEIGQERERC